MARLTLREEEMVEKLLNEVEEQPRANFETVATSTIEQLLGDIPVPKWANTDIGDSPIRFRYNIKYDNDKSMDDFDVMELLEERQEEQEDEQEEEVADPVPENEQPEPAALPPSQPWELEEFDREQRKKLEFDGSETCPRLAMFPKIRDAITNNDSYQSVQVIVSEAEKWFRYLKIQGGQVRDSAIFTLNETQYQLFIVGNQLHIFHSRNDFSEPITIDPLKNKRMNKLAVSACCKYIAIALPDQLLIYELKNVTSVVLFKNVTDLKTKDISHVGFYGEKYDKLYFVDQSSTLYLVQLSNALIFVKVDVKKLEICLKQIVEIAAIRYSIDADHFYLFAVTSHTETAVYMIEPTVQLLHLENFEDELIKAKLRHTKEQQLDSNSGIPVNLIWRYKKGFKPQLIICFLDYLLILKMAALRMMPVEADFVEFARVSHHHEILSMSFLSYNHLLLMQREGLTVVALPLLTSFSGIGNDTSYICYSDPNRYFRVTANATSSRQLALSQKVNIVRLIDLKDYVDRKLLENSDSRHVFGLLLLISKELNYSFGFSYSEADLTTLIARSVEMLLESLESVDAASNIFEIKTYWICELLVETKRQHILWGLVFASFRKQNKLSVFFDCMEQFLLKDSLNSDIPAETLSTLIPYFCSRNRQKTLLKALLRVNYEQHDVEKYLQTIGERQMYTLYIYLFQNFSEEDDIDFFTPFVKLFSSFRQALEHRGEDVDYKAKMCLWYLSKCFRGEKFPNRSMTAAERRKVIMSLVVQIVNTTFLKRLLEYDCKLTLQVLLLVLAQPTNVQIIAENESVLIQKFCSLYPQQKSDCDTFQACSLEHIRKIVPANGKILFSYFVCLLCQFNAAVKLETALQALQTILSVPLEQQHKPLLHVSQSGINEIGELAIMMIRTFKDFICGNKLYVKRLMAIKCEMKNLRSYLHFVGGDYHTSVLELLESPDKNELFSLVDDIVKSLSADQGALLDFLEFLRVHIFSLVQISPIKAYRVFRSSRYDEGKLLRELRKQPELRFQLLSAIIKETEQLGEQQNIQYLTQHLQLACQLHPEQLLELLATIQYPLDEGILICQKNNQFEGKAVLEERAGNILGALRSRQQAIKNLLKNAKDIKLKKLKERLSSQIEECIKLCQKHYSPSRDQDNFWLTLLQMMQDLEHGGNRQKVSLILELERHFSRILEMLYSYVPLESLNRYFMSDRSQDFSNKVRIHSWDILHRLNKFDARLYKQVINIAILDTVDARSEFNRRRSMALQTPHLACCLCDASLNMEPLSVLFQCQHISHRVCQRSDICLACQLESDELLFQAEVTKRLMKDAGIRVHDQRPQPPSLRKKTQSENKPDIFVVQLQDMADIRRKTRHRMKKFDLQVDAEKQRLEHNFDVYFEHGGQKEPFQKQPDLQLVDV